MLTQILQGEAVMGESLKDFIDMAIKKSWHHFDHYYATVGWVVMENPRISDAYAMERFLTHEIAPKILEIVSFEDEAQRAINILINRITITEHETAVSDHHAYDYGSPITQYVMNMSGISSLANNPQELRKLIASGIQS